MIGWLSGVGTQRGSVRSLKRLMALCEVLFVKEPPSFEAEEGRAPSFNYTLLLALQLNKTTENLIQGPEGC